MHWGAGDSPKATHSQGPEAVQNPVTRVRRSADIEMNLETGGFAACIKTPPHDHLCCCLAVLIQIKELFGESMALIG